MSKAERDGPARLLIAEDEAAVREFLVRGLIEAGYHVRAVGDGREALQALAVEQFDLLLTDIRMPRLDGVALALKVAVDFPDLKVLMMTGFASEQERAHNLDALSQRVIAKPFTLEEIRQNVADALAGI